MKPTTLFKNLCFLSFIVMSFNLAAQDFDIQPKNEVDKESNSEDNPEERQRFWYMQRADSNGNIPMDALIKAKKHIEKMPEPKDAGLWNWEWLGPGNTGGRIRAIAIHPTNTYIIFIGSVSGGIWKSSNGGISWMVIDDFLPSLAITSILYDPINTNIMYASTGEYFGNADRLPGAGIFKSTDDGYTWDQLESTNNDYFRWVTRIDHHPDSSGTLYAATASKYVWKTTDGGLSWDSVLHTPSPVSDVKVSPNHPHNYVIAGCTGSGGVYLSDDYGQTWAELTTGTKFMLPDDPKRCEVTFCPSNASRIYVAMGRNKGEIWRSDDYGNTWELKNTGTEYMGIQQFYNNTIWVDPTLSTRIVVGGIDNWRSTDGGETLTIISDGDNGSAHADNHIIINHPDYNAISNKTVYFGNDGGIYKTDDIMTVSLNSGWTNLNGTTLGITQFYGGAAAPDGSYITGGTQDIGVIQYTASGGPGSWNIVSGGDGGFAAIDYNNSLIQYGERVHLTIRKATDGQYFALAINGLTDALSKYSALFIAPFSMDPNTSTRLIAGGLRIWRTIDGAAQWDSIREMLPDSIKCSAIDIADGNSNIVWVGYTNGQVAKTSNGTATTPDWSIKDNNPTPLPNRQVKDIAINPYNHDEVFVTFSGYNPDNVWFTPDGGSTWENRSGTSPNDLPEIQVNTVRVNPHNGNWVYIGTDMGVFASEDQGINWCKAPRYPTAGHEFPGNIEVDELFWQGDDYLIAATHGRGIYRAHPLIILYVDKNAAPGGDGSAVHPFNNVTDATNAAVYGTAISIKSNTYNEPNPLLIYKSGEIITTDGPTIIK